MTENKYEYKLRYPVHTVDHKEIFPAGTVITGNTTFGTGVSQTGSEDRTYKLLEFGSTKADVLDFLSQSPYNVIFSGPGRVVSILEAMAGVQLKRPILESLEYFIQEDFYTYRHMMLVFALSILLSQELTKAGHNFPVIEGALASPVHDFGKICVPMKILKKATPLSVSERQILEHHTLAGYVLLKYYGASELSARIARDHHERMNGDGYPLGIPLKDRLVEIVVVSDIYDALISPRPYRPISYDNRTAIEEIIGKAEKGEIGWDVVKALVAANRKKKTHFSKCNISTEKRGTPPPNNLYGIIGEK